MTIYCPSCGYAVKVTPKVKQVRRNSEGHLQVDFEDVVIGHACPKTDEPQPMKQDRPL